MTKKLSAESCFHHGKESMNSALQPKDEIKYKYTQIYPACSLDSHML